MQRYMIIEEEEEKIVKLHCSPAVFASKNYEINSFDTPLEYPELLEINGKISDFFSPLAEIAKEGRICQIEDFLLTEITEFEA